AQRGDEIYITIELADARDNTSIWGKQYNRKLAGIVTLQEEITRDVSENLRLRLGAEDRKRLTQRYTENFEANLLYLKGRSHWNKHTKDSLKESIVYLHQAIEKDSNYALAYAGLADSYVALGLRDFGGGISPKEAMPLAREAALHALIINADLAEAHQALGNVLHLYDWKWGEAETQYKH